MFLKSLILKNIRSHKESKITFSEGSTVLSGSVGSGKSTLLYAVEFALFGLRRKKLSGNSLLRKGENEGLVELNLEIDKKDITIKKVLKRTKARIVQSECYLVIDGILHNLTPLELKAKIIGLLGYPIDSITQPKSIIYHYTVYCPQEDMREILSADPDIRMDILRKIFGIDKYKRIKENSAIFIKYSKLDIREKEVRAEGLDSDKESHKKILDEAAKIEKIISSISQEKKYLYEEIDKLNSKIALLMEEEKDLAEKKIRLSNLKHGAVIDKKRTEELYSKISSKEKEISSIPITRLKKEEIEAKITVLEKSIESSYRKKADLEARRDALISRKDSLIKSMERYSGIDDEYKELQEAIKNDISSLDNKKQLTEELDGLNKKRDNFTEMLKIYTINLNNSRDIKDKISSLSECPVCMQQVSDEYKSKVYKNEDEKISHMLSKIEECKARLEDIKEKTENISKELDTLLTIEKRIDKDRIRVIYIEDKIRERVRAIEEIKKIENDMILVNDLLSGCDKIDTDSLRKDISSLRKKLNDILNRDMIFNQREELRSELRKIESSSKDRADEIYKLEEEILGKDINKEDIEHMRNLLKEHSEKERAISIRDAELNTRKGLLSQEMERLQKEISHKESIIEEIKSKREVLDWLENMFTPLMTAMERQVMGKIYSEFNSFFKEWFSIMMGAEEISVYLDETFSPIVEQNGYNIDITDLSGGERTSAALSYRLALTKVINNVIDDVKTRGILILDEPTEGFSSEQIDRMRDLLETLGVRQSIIVTHENKLESFADNTIHINKENNISRVIC